MDNKPATDPAKPADGRTCTTLDVARNVFVVNMGTATWVYRFRKAGGASP